RIQMFIYNLRRVSTAVLEFTVTAMALIVLLGICIAPFLITSTSNGTPKRYYQDSQVDHKDTVDHKPGAHDPGDR
ncbi:MAG: hypothetical protein JXM70_30885, partial [Pirellulales bacterium]|nr:hypothetical protein [Pirellulales bacterium]